MMKTLIISIICFTSFEFVGQNLIGEFGGNYGCNIILKNDSTFKFKWHFDLIGSWTIGTWKTSGNKVFLNATTIFDTLQRPNQLDSLVLSSDEYSNRITNKEFLLSSLTASGQNKYDPPKILLYRKNKLFNLNNKGRINRKRGRGVYGKKYKPWYTRVN